MADSPTNLPELLERIDQAWSDLQASIADLSEEQLNIPDEGGWSIKDNLAHLSTWENYMLRHHLEGQPDREVMGVDEATWAAGEDAINAAIQKRSSTKTATQVLAEARHAHEEVLQILRTTPFADLLKPHYTDDPEQNPVLNWVIGNTYHHYAEHGAYIQKQVQYLKG